MENVTGENIVSRIEQLNAVEGFDPAAYLEEYTASDTSEPYLDLPLRARIGWFRLKYPEGRLTVNVIEGSESYTAEASVYRDYRDPMECSLAETSTVCGFDSQNSDRFKARKAAQNEAVTAALKLAGFELYFSDLNNSTGAARLPKVEGLSQNAPCKPVETEPGTVLSEEDRQRIALKAALDIPCPIARHDGKTLGDLITADPRALKWLATRNSGNAEVNNAAKLICDYALTATA